MRASVIGCDLIAMVTARCYRVPLFLCPGVVVRRPLGFVADDFKYRVTIFVFDFVKGIS